MSFRISPEVDAVHEEVLARLEAFLGFEPEKLPIIPTAGMKIGIGGCFSAGPLSLDKSRIYMNIYDFPGQHVGAYIAIPQRLLDFNADPYCVCLEVFETTSPMSLYREHGVKASMPHLVQDTLAHEYCHSVFHGRFLADVMKTMQTPLDKLMMKLAMGACDTFTGDYSELLPFYVAAQHGSRGISEAFAFWVEDGLAGHSHVTREIIEVYTQNHGPLVGESLNLFYTCFKTYDTSCVLENLPSIVEEMKERTLTGAGLSPSEALHSYEFRKHTAEVVFRQELVA